jgi:hypothetical protein
MVNSLKISAVVKNSPSVQGLIPLYVQNYVEDF